MNREDIIKLAREAGCKPFRSPEYWDDVQVFATPDVLERFFQAAYAAGAAAEREACAQLCDRFANRMMSAEECAAAIRARGNT